MLYIPVDELVSDAYPTAVLYPSVSKLRALIPMAVSNPYTGEPPPIAPSPIPILYPYPLSFSRESLPIPISFPYVGDAKLIASCPIAKLLPVPLSWLSAPAPIAISLKD